MWKTPSGDPLTPTASVSEPTTVFDRGAQLTCTCLTRAALDQSATLDGPGLVEDGTSTLYVPAGWQARSDDAGNLMIERKG